MVTRPHTSLRKQGLNVIGNHVQELVVTGESDEEAGFVHDVIRPVLIDDLPPTDVRQPASNGTKDGISSAGIPLLGPDARIDVSVDHTLQHLQDFVATPTSTNHLATQQSPS